MQASIAPDDADPEIARLSETIRLSPNSADAWVGRGRAYWNKREYDKAIADMTEAIRIETSSGRKEGQTMAEAYNVRGLAYTNKGQCDMGCTGFCGHSDCLF
jgi:tetratricopeptide (TPR) repeat protein